eukprot:Em0012g1073a
MRGRHIQPCPLGLNYERQAYPAKLITFSIIGSVVPLFGRRAVVPAVISTSSKIEELSGEVTDKSKAAGFPMTQLGNRGICWSRMAVVWGEVIPYFDSNPKVSSLSMSIVA